MHPFIHTARFSPDRLFMLGLVASVMTVAVMGGLFLIAIEAG